MKIIKPSVEILSDINGEEILKLIEKVGRVCYKSENKITDKSAKKFVKMLIDRGHEAMIEHYNITVKFICDRGVTHEIVRHRLASYAQESTRYCDYTKNKFDNHVTFIQPCWFKNNYNGLTHDKILQKYPLETLPEDERQWLSTMWELETTYKKLIKEENWSPQQARSVLPNSLKTEIIMTADLREWKHFLKLRTAKEAHPQMREVAIELLNKFKGQIPVVFNDIKVN